MEHNLDSCWRKRRGRRRREEVGDRFFKTTAITLLQASRNWDDRVKQYHHSWPHSRSSGLHLHLIRRLLRERRLSPILDTEALR